MGSFGPHTQTDRLTNILLLLYKECYLFSNTSTNLTDEEQELNKYSGYVYDAVWLYAYALDALIK